MLSVKCGVESVGVELHLPGVYYKVVLGSVLLKFSSST